MHSMFTSLRQVWVKKRTHIQRMAISKKSTFFVQSSWTLVKIITLNADYFHEDRIKIEDFSSMVNFLMWALFLTQTLRFYYCSFSGLPQNQRFWSQSHKWFWNWSNSQYSVPSPKNSRFKPWKWESKWVCSPKQSKTDKCRYVFNWSNLYSHKYLSKW